MAKWWIVSYADNTLEFMYHYQLVLKQYFDVVGTDSVFIKEVIIDVQQDSISFPKSQS